MTFESCSGATNIVGAITILLVAIILLVNLATFAQVSRFRAKTRRGRLLPLRSFNSLWPIRILLVVSSSLWAVSELLRLPIIRCHGGAFSELSSVVQASLCRANITIGVGLAEPCFFLAALFLVKVGPGSAIQQPGKSFSVIAEILIPSCIAFFVHAGVSIITGRLTGITQFLGSVAIESGGVVWCKFPLANTLAAAWLGSTYVSFFLTASWEMMGAVINRKLSVRVQSLAGAVIVSMPAHVLLMGLSVFWAATSTWFQVASMLSFLSIVVCMAVAQVILVIRPIMDALAVDVEAVADQVVQVSEEQPVMVVVEELWRKDEEEGMSSGGGGGAILGKKEILVVSDGMTMMDR